MSAPQGERAERTAFCFDMDGTITRVEVLPCIASELGIADEMAALTKATMDGHIDFEPSFRLRCLLLGQIDPEVVRRIVGAIPLDPDVLDFISERREDCFILTGNLDVWIRPIVEACGCHAFSSTGFYGDGRLNLRSILNKAHALQEIRDRFGYGQIVAVGDGANDAAMLDLASVGIAFGGVHRPAQSAILASTYVVNDGHSLCRLLRAL
jgi:HAD superfamily phosphoserine phosphatase-like hydrolase